MNFCIVKRDVTPSAFIPHILIGISSVIAATLSTAISLYLAVIILALGAFLVVALLPSATKCEYEYAIEGDLFYIALIKNKSSRKELFSCDISKLVSCSVEKPHSNNAEKINASVKNSITYHALFSVEEKIYLVSFSPSNEFLNNLRLLAPLKVKINIM